MEEFKIELNDFKPEQRERPKRPPTMQPQRTKSVDSLPGRPPMIRAPPAGQRSIRRSTALSNASSCAAGGSISVSDHDTDVMADDWFTMGSRNASSDGFGGSEDLQQSLHNDGKGGSSPKLNRGQPRPGRGNLSRGFSARRMEYQQAKQQLQASSEHGNSSRSRSPPKHGVSRSKSGAGVTRTTSRTQPMRTRSDALLSARRESMKALYRNGPDDATVRSELGGGPCVGTGGGALDGENDGRDRERPARRDRPPTRTKSGLEGGALAGVMERHPPSRTRSTDSSGSLGVLSHHSLDRTSAHSGDESDPKWLERRATKQSEIMTLAHDVKERFHEARGRQEELEFAMHHHAGDGNFEDDDDDQPMAMRTKKTMLEQLKKVANKTGAGARSFGKGTVNAISDPKLAAKRFGHLSKDVGKATIKTALDPKKMAKATKNVTVGSAKIGAGLTKGVIGGTYGASKAVVKGGVNATTSGAKLTMKGTKKVVKGTVRAVKGKDKNKRANGLDDYNSRTLADRNKSEFLDRISSMVETNSSAGDPLDDELEEAILAGIEAEESAIQKSATGSRSAPAKPKGSSVLMPIDLMGTSQGSWDV